MVDDDLSDFLHMQLCCSECGFDFGITRTELAKNPELVCPWGHITLVASGPGNSFRTISARKKAILDRRKKRNKRLKKS